MIQDVTDNYEKRDFWIHENRQYAKPNFRLRRCARLLEDVVRGRTCDLLDVGCGPAALRTLLGPTVNYHGIDIAIQEPAPYLLERDFVSETIAFRDKRFDVVVALGVFEYMGRHQAEKLRDISRILKPGGTFILSYINFRHFRRRLYPAYNNVQSIASLSEKVQQVFEVERCFPVSHHWRHKQPGHLALPGIQMRLSRGIPGISPWLAVEYFLVCSKRA